MRDAGEDGVRQVRRGIILPGGPEDGRVD
jgi:hypothetical protein